MIEYFKFIMGFVAKGLSKLLLTLPFVGVLGFWGDRKSTRLNSSHP